MPPELKYAATPPVRNGPLLDWTPTLPPVTDAPPLTWIEPTAYSANEPRLGEAGTAASPVRAAILSISAWSRATWGSLPSSVTGDPEGSLAKASSCEPSSTLPDDGTLSASSLVTDASSSAFGSWLPSPTGGVPQPALPTSEEDPMRASVTNRRVNRCAMESSGGFASPGKCFPFTPIARHAGGNSVVSLFEPAPPADAAAPMESWRPFLEGSAM